MKIKILLLSLLPLSSAAQNMKEIDADFQLRMQQNPQLSAMVDKLLISNAEERTALHFLYAYMDLADAFNKTPNYWLENVRVALKARKETLWGKETPFREWLHFVLPVRVNNEYLDDFRTIYYDSLQTRLEGLSWHQAALEVNHWLHEKASYRPSDSRTSSPLATIRTATGRCGEESTLGVAAYRTIGIPARQVYTPRWAHTDDNHAWVEIYVDGKWHFIGACEPAPDLDIAWFNAPARRGMMMSTTVLGKYEGTEQVLRKSPRSTTINVTENYAPVIKQTATIVDAEGNSVEGATVRFGLYNYAEFYPLFVTSSDREGQASLLTGRGDMLVWAAKDGRYGWAKIGPQESGENCVVRLTHEKGERYEQTFKIVPPPVSSPRIEIAKEEEMRNNMRLAKEDSIRRAYIATWSDSTEVAQFALKNNYSSTNLQHLFYLAEGNYKALEKFLKKNADDRQITVAGVSLTRRMWAMVCLQQLTRKDIRDFNEQIVQSQLDSFLKEAPHQALEAYPLDIVKKYVLNPRIGVEELSPWRRNLSHIGWMHDSSKGKRIDDIVSFLNNEVQTDTLSKSRYLLQRPEAVVRYRHANRWSKGYCFVAMARTVGIPARYNTVTSQFEYFALGDWHRVSFEKGNSVRKEDSSVLKMDYSPRKYLPNPGYYHHFTLSKMKKGMPTLLNYSESATYDNTFKGGTTVTKGDYLMTSGLRLANGSVICRLSMFPVERDTTAQLVIPADSSQVAVIGNLNAESKYLDVKTQTMKTLLSTTGRGYYALALLRAHHEPSTHILHDLEVAKKRIETWGRPLMLLFKTKKDYKDFMAVKAEFKNLPENVYFGVDETGDIAKQLTCQPLTESDNMPIVVIADTFNRVVFFSQGYSIGIGDKLFETISKM